MVSPFFLTHGVYKAFSTTEGVASIRQRWSSTNDVTDVCRVREKCHNMDCDVDTASSWYVQYAIVINRMSMFSEFLYDSDTLAAQCLDVFNLVN